MEIYQPTWFIPTYQPVQHGDWQVQIGPMVLCKGYWSPARLCLNMAGLLRREADGTLRTWMSMTPMEIESQELGCQFARGHVLVMGMGMGWAAANSALRPEVTRVTVVERDPLVLSMIETLDIFGQLPDAARAKIHIVQGDALAYVPDQPVDLLMPDIWLPLVSDGRVEQVRQMAENCRPKQIYFWGQEMEIARHARAWGLGWDAPGIQATVERFGLPLLIPEGVDYPAKLAAAANHWMQDRWLPAAA
ncbi:hypothetical protein [Niveispirillum irakense]|uniref:hypothetical protein n=1 Tax=Niveispirillum irakense TaxID=34011 RepID=UPI0003FC42BB|nr:hypothetical protein [Niveispirillum irakense]